MYHILSCEQFSRKELEELFSLADDIKNNRDKYSNVLSDKVIATIFYEPSTRSRLSFESSIQRVGAKNISTENAREALSAIKGESLQDTIRIVQGYSDAIVLRHPDNNSAYEAASVAKVPIINAGSGSAEHPTQALLDVYTILEYKKKVDGISICVLGDLRYGRTVHSLLKLLALYNNITVYGLSVKELSLPEEYITYLKERNISFVKCNSFKDIPKDIDILYHTRYQKERFEQLGIKEEAFIINSEVLNSFSDNTFLMHPLPRVNEISPDVDDDKRSIYFLQAHNGMYIRMALFYKIFYDKQK